MEHFYTIQGEGMYQGTAAYFIRLAGCDVGCVWCDVKESWDSAKHPVINIDQLVRFAVESKTKIVVITGGEPLMYDLSTLTAKLQAKGLRTHIETSGAHPLSGSWDWFCLSPKKFKAPLSENTNIASELKVIVFNKSDFAWAELYEQEVPETCQLYLQPEWGKKDQMIPLIVEYVKQNPRWKICLQSHKYMDIP